MTKIVTKKQEPRKKRGICRNQVIAFFQGG